MTRLPIIRSAEMGRILIHLGFSLLRQKGSHAYYRHADGRATVVPVHRGEDLGRGLVRAILRDIELAPADFERVRKEL